MSGLQHRLAAILAADAAGYSRLMAIDDQATVAALDAARTVFRQQIEAQQGRVVDMAGDSVLAVFGRAAGAVTASLAIQAQVNALADAAPEDRDMRFRIGVHLGDVIEKADGTVYGDGVNIAARLQALAEPGGITVSESIRSAGKNKVAASFEDQGEQAVKNIADPVCAWGLRAPGLRSAAPRALQPTLASAPETNLPARPTRLISRADEVAQARRPLGAHRLVTVTAVGGSGKTRLAIAIGEEELAQRPQGVWFTDLTVVMKVCCTGRSPIEVRANRMPGEAPHSFRSPSIGVRNGSESAGIFDRRCSALRHQSRGAVGLGQNSVDLVDGLHLALSIDARL